MCLKEIELRGTYAFKHPGLMKFICLYYTHSVLGKIKTKKINKRKHNLKFLILGKRQKLYKVGFSCDIVNVEMHLTNKLTLWDNLWLK